MNTRYKILLFAGLLDQRCFRLCHNAPARIAMPVWRLVAERIDGFPLGTYAMLYRDCLLVSDVMVGRKRGGSWGGR